MSKSGFIYLLESEKDNSLYFGSTNDINRRLQEHNAGKTISTKNRAPWKAIVVIRFSSLASAKSIEQKLKSHKQKLTKKWFLEALS